MAKGDRFMALSYDPNLRQEDSRQKFIECALIGGSIRRKLLPSPGPERISGQGDIIKRIVNGFYVWKEAASYVNSINARQKGITS